MNINIIVEIPNISLVTRVWTRFGQRQTPLPQIGITLDQFIPLCLNYSKTNSNYISLHIIRNITVLTNFSLTQPRNCSGRCYIHFSVTVVTTLLCWLCVQIDHRSYEVDDLWSKSSRNRKYRYPLWRSWI